MSGTDGVCLWFTGRSGAGKSTIVRSLLPAFERAGRAVTVLDVVPVLEKLPGERTSEGKLLRKGFVASEIVRHGGIVICVTVSARRATREAVRSMIGPAGFIEVFVDPPAELARARKRARGRRPTLSKRWRSLRHGVGALTGKRGEGYEAPASPDLRIDTAASAPEEGARLVLDLLVERGFVNEQPGPDRPLDADDVRRGEPVGGGKG